MNDHHLDPPDEPDPPSCPVEGCDGFDDGTGGTNDGVTWICRCDECDHEWSMTMPAEPCEEIDDHYEPVDMPEEDPLCPHGNRWHECDACFAASDFAYDAAR